MPCGAIWMPNATFTRRGIMPWRNIETAISVVVKIGTFAIPSVLIRVVSVMFLGILIPVVIFSILFLPMFVLVFINPFPRILV